MAFITGYLACGSGNSANSFAEINTVGYYRQPITLTQSGPYVSNNGSVTFSSLSLGLDKISQHAIYDAPTGGNLLLSWLLPSPKTFSAMSPDAIAIGGIAISFPDTLSAMTSFSWSAGQSVGLTKDGQVVVAGSAMGVVKTAGAAVVTVQTVSYPLQLPSVVPTLSQWPSDLIPAQHLAKFIASSTPKVCLVGDSTMTSSGSNQLVFSEDFYHQLQRYMKRPNPTKTISFSNYAIGGQVWGSLASTPSAFPSWYFNTALPWLAYIQAQNPTTLLIGFGINDADYAWIGNIVTVLTNVATWGTAPAAWQSNHAYAQGAIITDSNGRLQIVATAGTSTNGSHPTWATSAAGASTTDTGVTWQLLNTAVYAPLVPDIIFITNKNTNPAAGGAYSTALNQNGTVAAASATRTVAYSGGAGLGVTGLPPIGLIDIGRLFTMAVSGYDPASSYFIQSISQPITGITSFPYFFPATPSGDFDVTWTFNEGSALGSGPPWNFFITTGQPGSYQPSQVEFTASGGNVTVQILNSSNATPVSATIGGWNAGNNTIQVTAKQERVTVSVNGTVALDVVTARYVVPGFQPQIYSYQWPTPTMTINSYNVGVPRIASPTVPSGEAWGNIAGANGNFYNHSASVAINASDVPLLEGVRFA